jgi:hypothetical protein
VATWNSISDDALRKIGRIGSGDTGSAQERTDAVAELNRMLGKWSAELGPIFGQVAESLTWASGNASRTIGSGGDLATARPQSLVMAQYRDANNVDTDLPILTHDEYQGLPDKATTGEIPQLVAYNPTFAGSLGTLFVYPVPSASFTLRLTSIKPLATVSDATATITLPPGYEDAILWNLMLRLCGEYGVPVQAFWAQQAYESKHAIEQLNSTPSQMWPDYMAPGMGGCERDPVAW